MTEEQQNEYEKMISELYGIIELNDSSLLDTDIVLIESGQGHHIDPRRSELRPLADPTTLHEKQFKPYVPERLVWYFPYDRAQHVVFDLYCAFQYKGRYDITLTWIKNKWFILDETTKTAQKLFFEVGFPKLQKTQEFADYIKVLPKFSDRENRRCVHFDLDCFFAQNPTSALEPFVDYTPICWVPENHYTDTTGSACLGGKFYLMFPANFYKVTRRMYRIPDETTFPVQVFAIDGVSYGQRIDYALDHSNHETSSSPSSSSFNEEEEEEKENTLIDIPTDHELYLFMISRINHCDLATYQYKKNAYEFVKASNFALDCDHATYVPSVLLEEKEKRGYLFRELYSLHLNTHDRRDFLVYRVHKTDKSLDVSLYCLLGRVIQTLQTVIQSNQTSSSSSSSNNDEKDDNDEGALHDPERILELLETFYKKVKARIHDFVVKELKVTTPTASIQKNDYRKHFIMFKSVFNRDPQ